jgi:alkylation response protein AidB-like acyl-CoA dehydrogenase
MIRDACTDIDRTRRIPAPVITALQELDVFRLLAPREIGGLEVEPITFLDMVEAASYADGSVGWCAMLGGCYATFGGLLPADGARTIFGDPTTIAAGAFRPDGVAHEVAGGYRVSGRWPLGSGSSHANWFVGGCMILRKGEPIIAPNGAPTFREFFFPSTVTEIIDTWDATGLRGTASHDYAVTDVFVPAAHGTWFQERPTLDAPLYRMPPIAMFATFIGAVPLGIARHAIDAFIELAPTKTPVLSNAVLADHPVAQATLGRARATVGAGRAYLRDTLVELWERVEAGHAPTLADRGALWLTAAHAAHTATAAIETLYSAAGANSVYGRCPLDRCLRDARTATQHICAQELNFELAGKVALDRLPMPNVWAMDYRGEG